MPPAPLSGRGHNKDMQLDKHVNNQLLKCSVQTFDIDYIHAILLFSPPGVPRHDDFVSFLASYFPMSDVNTRFDFGRPSSVYSFT